MKPPATSKTTSTLRATVLTIGILLTSTSASHAGCGLDPLCHLSESLAKGGGRGVSEGVRPLVTEVMTQQAPALIAQLQAGVDHNVITAEQAAQRLSDYVAKLVEKSSSNIISNVKEDLILYAMQQAMLIEKDIMRDVMKIIDSFHCETLSVNLLMERQINIFDEKVNDWLKKILVWWKFRNTVEMTCRAELGLNPTMSFSQMGIPSTSRMWRCVRLRYVDVNGHPEAILDAYEDVVSNGQATMCALRMGNPTALERATETWMADTQAANTWRRTIRGE